MIFSDIEESLNKQSIKKNENKSLRDKLVKTYPSIEPFLEDLWPKDANVEKCRLHIEDFLITTYFINGELKYMEDRDHNLIPTMRILHSYPFMMPHMRCDKGAIKHILSGSHVMCPGLTHPNATMVELKKGSVVAIMAEGKEHAMGVGITAMSTDEICKVNKGVGIDLIMFLNDGLWKLTRPQPTI